jgi:acyl-CoA synthetase (AMP-forming)/AMP-acid ligase II
MLRLAPSDRSAIVDGQTGHAVTYRQLLDDARRLASSLGDQRSLLMVACRNDRQTVTAYAAALVTDHPLLLVDGARGPETFVDLIDTYRPTWLAGSEGTGAALDAAGVRVADLVRTDHGELVRLPGAPPVLHQDLALLLSTSGTTGSRKLVRLSKRNLDSNAAAIATMLGLDIAERPVTSLPLHYTFGLSVLNSHWYAGATVVLTSESVLQRSFWDIFDRHGCTSIAGVPYTFQMLERVGFRQMALPSLTTIQQAGGALSASLTDIYARYMAERGGRLHVMYGQTEATARMAWLPPERLKDKAGSAGRAIPGGRLSIADAAVDVQSGQAVGEVVYEGPNVMMGYAEAASDLASGDVQGGRLRTGDIGWLDDEGFLFITGRSKRIAKVFGLRVNLDEVELALRDSGPAAVVAGEDGIWAFCAFGTDEYVTGLAAETSKRLRIHRSALRFQRVDAIPTMASGKVDYQEVQRWTRS